MKKLFTLIVFTILSTVAMAQHGNMVFVGKSNFKAFTASVDNETDTVIFKMNSFTTADITLPSMYYKDMNLTIPSITIHDLTFGTDASRNAVFADQTWEETVAYGDGTRTVKGTSFTATYDHSAQQLTVTTTLNFGSMPFPLTYTITGTYDRAATGITEVKADREDNATIYSLDGKVVSNPQAGQLYIKNGRKYIQR